VGVGGSAEELAHVLADALARFRRVRPDLPYNPHVLSYVAWPQVWGSTALGFPRIGLQVVTTAQTHVVTDTLGDGGHLVYFGGEFAYRVERPNAAFEADRQAHRLRPLQPDGSTPLYEQG